MNCFISILVQMDEDKGKGSSTTTKAVSERLQDEVCKAHIKILFHPDECIILCSPQFLNSASSDFEI